MPAAVRIPTADEVAISLAADSLRHLIREAWPLVEPKMPLAWGWYGDAICEHLEAVTAGEIDRLLINQPPRTSKSLIVNVFWPVWEWIKRPELRYLSISHSEQLATRDAVRSRSIMRHAGSDIPAEEVPRAFAGSESTMLRLGYPRFVELAGEPWRFSGDQNLKSQYENDRKGKRIATGLTGKATGEGGDRVIIDDPIDINDANSEAKIYEASSYVTEFAPTRLNSSDGALVLVMQRVSEDDPTGAVLSGQDASEWTHLCLPMEYEPSHPFVWPRDPRTEPGELLTPERYDAAWVGRRKRGIGSRAWAANYQQTPSPAEGEVFKKGDWRRWSTLPHVWQRLLISWDLTSGKKPTISDDARGRSWVVGQLWGKDGPDLYLLGQIRGRFPFTKQCQAVKDLAAWARSHEAERYPDQPATILEDAAAAVPLLEVIESELAGIKLVRPDGDKYARAEAQQPLVEGHNVYLPETEVIPAPPGYEPTTVDELLHEMTVFPAGSNDDQVDAFSQAARELFGPGRSKTVRKITKRKVATEPVIERHGLTLRGKHHIDREDRPKRRR